MISLNDLSLYSSRILASLEHTDVVLNLVDLLDSKILFGSDEYVQVEFRPSVKTFCYTITYIIEGRGMPIEARINEAENYIVLFCKSINKLEGYEPFRTDVFGNYLYSKTIKSAEIADLKNELKKLIV